jgi:hypothetical protein
MFASVAESSCGIWIVALECAQQIPDRCFDIRQLDGGDRGNRLDRLISGRPDLERSDKGPRAERFEQLVRLPELAEAFRIELGRMLAKLPHVLPAQAVAIEIGARSDAEHPQRRLEVHHNLYILAQRLATDAHELDEYPAERGVSVEHPDDGGRAEALAP